MSVATFTSDLRRWSSALKELGNRPLERALDQGAKLIGEDLVKTFHSEEDPHGRKWKERVVEREWPINLHNGKLDRSREVKREGHSVVVDYTADYSEYVDNQRMIVPDRLPKKWVEILDEAVAEEFDKHLQG